MANAGASRRAERREALGGRLLEAVERIAAEGIRFNDASIERLAAESGISRATFYLYYEDKADFLRQATRDVFAELYSASTIWWDVADAGVRSDLERSMAAIVAAYVRHRAVLTAVSEAAATDPRASKNYLDVMANVIDAVQDAINRGVQAGTMKSVPSTTAAVLTWMVERSCTQLLVEPSPDLETTLIDTFTEVIYSTLYIKRSGRTKKA